MENEKLNKLQHFFSADMQIKKTMYNMSPLSIEQYSDQETIVNYTDSLEESLIYIFSELKCISTDIFGIDSDVYQKVTKLEKSIKEKFYNCGLDFSKLRSFYKECISSMDLEFLDTLKDECVGYKFCNTSPVEKTNSINEFLHFVHSYITNNEDILQSLPSQKERLNKEGYPITLRGVSNNNFEKIFEDFPLDLECGWTDMVAINEKKLLMMVRDIGHALTVEISLKHDKARIEYFVPKICNLDMVNSLPGVNPVTKDSVGATGVIEVDIDELSNKLYDFISKVPTDEDIIIPTYFANAA